MPARIQEEAVNLRKVPDDVIFAEARERARKLKAKHGPYATLKKFRKCKGCKVEMSARQIRSHTCPSGLAWPQR